MILFYISTIYKYIYSVKKITSNAIYKTNDEVNWIN